MLMRPLPLLVITALGVSACYGASDIRTTGMEEANPVEDAELPDGEHTDGDHSCEGETAPGRPTLHRLNKAEYDNTVRDLLGDTSRPAQGFPSDDVGYGFDNNGDVLSMAPLLVEKYDAAAETLVTTVLAKEGAPGQLTQVDALSMTATAGAASGDYWNLYSAGTLTTSINVTSAGSAVIRVRAYGQQAGSEPAKMTLRVDGADVQSFDVTAVSASPAIYSHTMTLTAGAHTFAVAFTNDFYDAATGADRNLLVDYLELERAGSVADPSTAKVRICDPAIAGEAACFRTIVTTLAKKAWRRPLTVAESDKLMSFLQLAKANGDGFEVGVNLALHTVLLSPHFLFRVELDADPTAATVHRLNDYELATRLSYFLWSSTPDDALMAAAERGELSDDAKVLEQVTRMLADPKAAAFTKNFGGQWLMARNVASVTPDPVLFPGFDAALKDSMQKETEAFFQAFVDEERPVKDMLDADFTYLNDRLASHYGLPAPGSTELKRVSLNGTNRGGLLTLGSLLTVTSNVTRTSPVKRGKWVLGSLMCAEPPAPPPNVEALAEPVNPTGTLRERMEAHRNNAICSSCHSSMDPIGFGMENYDAVGKYRTHEPSGAPIDAASTMPDGQAFNGTKELSAILKSDPRLTTCVADKLLTYATGRGVTEADHCAVKRIAERATIRGGKLTDYVVEIAVSTHFTHRQGEPLTGGAP